MSEQDKNEAHKKKMAKQKEKVDANIAAADIERGIVLLLTGNGKGKSSSGFGMVLRALGYNHKVGVVQFIKGAPVTELAGGFGRTHVLAFHWTLARAGYTAPMATL